jgi:hypothetical protein
MTERVHRHPGSKIKITITVRRDEPSPFPALEREIGARVGREQMRCQSVTHRGRQRPNDPNEMCRLSKAAPGYSIAGRTAVNV